MDLVSEINVYIIIINMYFCMKIAIFYSRLFQNSYKNVSIVNMFLKNFFTRSTTYSKRVSEIFIFLDKKW